MASIAALSISSCTMARKPRMRMGRPRLWKVSPLNFSWLSRMFETGMRLFSEL